MWNKPVNPVKLLTIAFLAAILVGAALLMLPQASVSGHPISLVDALFMATSAVCVTGLSVLDVGVEFTLFGQIVILLLIQGGGLGIMTFALSAAILLGHRASFQEASYYKEQVSFLSANNLRRMFKHIFVLTFVCEAVGALILWWRFQTYQPQQFSIWYSAIFHSVSAFCNAGFGLYSDSLQSFKNDPFVCWTVIFLIIAGGIGFLVWEDAYGKLKALKKGKKYTFSLHTKLVVITTIVLILIGALSVGFLEMGKSLKGLGVVDGITASFFRSVTARTAGFSVLETTSLSNPTLLMMMFLMFVGGSPASCAGGVKTITFIIVVLTIFARMRGNENVSLFRRQVPFDIITKAISIVIVSGVWILGTTFLLQLSEAGRLPVEFSRGALMNILFEVISAYGTVGLSLGQTPFLSVVGKLVIIVTMFVGRVGPLTLAIALLQKPKRAPLYTYAEENVMVG